MSFVGFRRLFLVGFRGLFIVILAAAISPVGDPAVLFELLQQRKNRGVGGHLGSMQAVAYFLNGRLLAGPENLQDGLLEFPELVKTATRLFRRSCLRLILGVHVCLLAVLEGFYCAV